MKNHHSDTLAVTPIYVMKQNGPGHELKQNGNLTKGEVERYWKLNKKQQPMDHTHLITGPSSINK